MITVIIITVTVAAFTLIFRNRYKICEYCNGYGGDRDCSYECLNCHSTGWRE